jgi:CBS domain-containing protein
VAARRIGFTRAYDCVAGKADWGSFGLPLEGEADSRTRIGSIARGDTPTCRPDEFFSAVAQRVADEWQICVVTNERRIVMGILGRRALRSCFPVPAEEAMSAGPSTLRPSARLDAVALLMRERNLTRIVVTCSDGVLTGVLRRADIALGVRADP